MGRKYLSKKLSGYERAGLAIILILTIGSFIMMIVSFFMQQDSTIWMTTLLTTLSFIGGLLVGSNRRINIP